jgi:hypothetical protein
LRLVLPWTRGEPLTELLVGALIDSPDIVNKTPVIVVQQNVRVAYYNVRFLSVTNRHRCTQQALPDAR